jgi:hypothetical protein
MMNDITADPESDPDTFQQQMDELLNMIGADSTNSQEIQDELMSMFGEGGDDYYGDDYYYNGDDGSCPTMPEVEDALLAFD